MEEEGMDLEIIINPKNTDDGMAVIQVRSHPHGGAGSCS